MLTAFLPGIPAGSYLLQVSNGSSKVKNATFDVTLGSVGPEGPAGAAGAAGTNGTNATFVDDFSGSDFNDAPTGNVQTRTPKPLASMTRRRNNSPCC